MSDLSAFEARRTAALAELAARNATDNDAFTAIRVTFPRDAYDALDLLHTRCMDHLDPNTIEEHPVTRAIGKFLDELADLCPEITP